ncbi:hypothetical protein OL397_004501 [Salmonella enterica]|nr:hypothetical protein [Salmonella enterica]
MRYWILVALLYGLFSLIMHFAAPEKFGSTEHYVGAGICALIAMVITWRDPPDMLENMLLFLFKWGVLVAGLVFFVWGIGYKLAIWGEHNSGELVSSVFDTIMPNLAILTGIMIFFGVYLHIRNR